MQITINTSDIMGDETTIRDEVISQVVNALLISMIKDAKAMLVAQLEVAIDHIVKEQVSTAITLALDTEFQTIDEYGREGRVQTVRGRIADKVQQCTCKKANYSSEQTPFANAVDSVVQAEVAKFKKDFDSLVTRKVVEESADIALAKLKAAMGIK